MDKYPQASCGCWRWTYLLISSEWTLYRLSSLYLPGLARASIATLFLYLVVVEAAVEVEHMKVERGQHKNRGHRRSLEDSGVKEENHEDM